MAWDEAMNVLAPSFSIPRAHRCDHRPSREGSRNFLNIRARR
jgi:hypothetical protein